jgi:hypothetical protein
MIVKEPEDIVEALERAQTALQEAVAGVEHTKSTLETEAADGPATVAGLAQKSGVSEDAVVAFVETVHDVLGADLSLSVEAARRGALLAASSQAWESEIGPLLGTANVRGLLGVSRQRVDELLRSNRLIALSDRAGHRRYPAFQFHDGQPMPPLIAAFWTLADAAVSPWTAASWCTSADEALDGLSPVKWARRRRDAATLARVARQDAARLDR